MRARLILSSFLVHRIWLVRLSQSVPIRPIPVVRLIRRARQVRLVRLVRLVQPSRLA